MRAISCGIIVYNKGIDGKYYFLVTHAGGPYNQKKDQWALPKGHVEEGESHVETAIREFNEETGLNMKIKPEKLVDLGQVRQSGAKDVHAFALKSINKFDLSKCFSNLCEEGWPEIDRYEWKEYSEVVQKTIKTHIPFYDKIVNEL